MSPWGAAILSAIGIDGQGIFYDFDVVNVVSRKWGVVVFAWWRAVRLKSR